jgi:hypothetical protein
MISKISQNFDWFIGVSITLMLPDVLLIISGIRNIRTNSALAIGRNGYFQWKKPNVLTGKDARDAGGCSITLGIGIVVYGLILIFWFIFH